MSEDRRGACKGMIVDALHKLLYGSMADAVSDAVLSDEAEKIVAKYYDPDPTGKGSEG